MCLWRGVWRWHHSFHAHGLSWGHVAHTHSYTWRACEYFPFISSLNEVFYFFVYTVLLPPQHSQHLLTGFSSWFCFIIKNVAFCAILRFDRLTAIYSVSHDVLQMKLYIYLVDKSWDLSTDLLTSALYTSTDPVHKMPDPNSSHAFPLGRDLTIAHTPAQGHYTQGLRFTFMLGRSKNLIEFRNRNEKRGLLESQKRIRST